MGRPERPDWLPEDYRYTESLGDCDFCGGLARHGALECEEWGADVEWCDSPECEQAAREAITGGDDAS